MKVIYLIKKISSSKWFTGFDNADKPCFSEYIIKAYKTYDFRVAKIIANKIGCEVKEIKEVENEIKN